MRGPRPTESWWSARVLRSIAALLLVAAGCSGTAAEHEFLGDRAFAEGRYGDALVEYRLDLVQRGSQPHLHTKAGVAALQALSLIHI